MARAGLEPRTTIRLCGGLRLEVDGQDFTPALPTGQAGSLLSFLISRPERAADRHELIDALWPEQPPKNPQAVLRPLLSRLRRALEPVALEGRERLRLALPEPVWLDTDAATTAVAAARAAARSADWARVREQADMALGLLRPGFLPAHEGEWLEQRRRELEELELEALEWVARASLALGGPELAAGERAGREIIARSPYRETGHRFLMEALAATGNVAEALRAYEQLRLLLREELGVAPAPELQSLHRRLLTGEGAPERSGSSRRRPLPALLAPRERSQLVGRDRHLDVLRKAWRDTRSGARRLVLVSGQPGIGKTRLTTEFALEAHNDGAVLYAACQEEALLPYQPFVEALRHYAQAAEADLSGFDLGPGAAELGRLVPELATTTQVPAGDPELRRYLMLDAVSSFLTEASARAPLVVILDDLHWADKATLQLLRHVIRAPHPASVLIVGTYRDAGIGAGHPLAGLLADLRRDRLFERVALEGLDEPGVRALIASHAGHEASSGLVKTVHERTEGNPFFVEEVLRHLIETGVLYERGGRWTSALTPDEMGVPEGVKEVLARRLDLLSEVCRTALSHAAVLGREFSFAVLRAMAGAGEDELIAGLEEAVAAQLIVEARERAEPAYQFTHALVRETLYGGLGAPRRERLHARAAAAVEAVEGEAPVAALAAHHRLAGSAGDPAKAIDYSLRAGERARELSAWEEVAAHWDGALAVLAPGGGRRPERARLLVALAEVMVVVGDLGRQIAYLEQALALYEEIGEDERAAQLHSRLGMAHALIDSIDAEHLDIGRAFRHFDAARARLEHGRPRRSRGHLETGKAAAYTYGLRIEPGIEAAARAMEIAEQLGDEVLWVGGAEAYGWHKLQAGALDEGISTLARAFEVADRLQRPFLAWMASNTLGQLTWGLGSPAEAQPFFERLLRLPYAGRTAYRQQIADGIGRCHLSKGEMAQARRHLADAKPSWVSHSLEPLVDLWEGAWDPVEKLAVRARETSRRTGNRWDEWASCHLAARVRYLRGELDAAGALLEAALTIVVDGRSPYFELWVRPDLARVRAESGRADEARAHADRCLVIVANGENWRGRAGHAALADAVVLALEGRMDEAEVRFAAAQETFSHHALAADEAEALHEWGRALARAGAVPEAAAMLDRALGIYRRLGAGPPWLERVGADRRRA